MSTTVAPEVDQWKRVTPHECRRSLSYNDHPLRLLFRQRRFTTREGMDWLQQRGHISDLCIEPEDVARVDAERVLAMAGAEWLGRAFDNLIPRQLIVPPHPRTAPCLVKFEQ